MTISLVPGSRTLPSTLLIPIHQEQSLLQACQVPSLAGEDLVTLSLFFQPKFFRPNCDCQRPLPERGGPLLPVGIYYFLDRAPETLLACILLSFTDFTKVNLSFLEYLQKANLIHHKFRSFVNF